MFPISIKSIELVQDVIQLTEEHNTNSLRIYALGEYETVSRTEHFIEMLQRFRSAGKSTLVDVAYHCMTWRMSGEGSRGLAGLDLAALGIPDEATYLQRYPDGYTCHYIRPGWKLPVRTT